MLLGSFEHSIDDKGRLIIPSKIRNKLGELVYVSKGFEGCLEIRHPEKFEQWSTEILSSSNTNSSTRLLMREIFANAAEVDFDSVGRIKVPNNLLQNVGITKNVIILGLGNKLEIWDKEKYSKYLKDNSSKLEDVAEKFGGAQ